MTDNEIKTEKSDLYRDYSSSWSGFDVEARLDTEIHLGAHFTPEQLRLAAEQGRTLYPFNKTARQVELLAGYETRNRHILKIGPVDKEDDLAANQHTKIIMQQMAYSNGYDIVSDCFKWGSLVSGSNLLEVFFDRNGVLQFNRRAFSSFLLDPATQSSDLRDCRNILTGQWLHEDNIKQLLPTEADDIDRIKVSNASKWPDAPNWARQEDVRMLEEWWGLRSEFVDFVYNRLTGEEESLADFAEKRVSGSKRAARDLIKALTTDQGIELFVKYKKWRQKVIYRVFVDSELVWDGENPSGLDEYNFVWFNGEWCPEMPREELKCRSLTNKLRYPQNAYDKRMNQIMDMVETSIQSGKVFREGALVNPDDAYKSGQGVGIEIKKEFNDKPLQDILLELQGKNIPAGLFQALELIEKSETQTTGMNEELLGTDESKDIPGILHKYRTGQALTAQAGIFQRFRAAKRQLGAKLVKLNQIWLIPEDVRRMTNEPPAAGFYDPDFVRFDCVPTEGLLTDSQRQLHFLQMQELYQMFPNIIPASMVIQSAPVAQPRELLEAIRSNEQKQSQMMQAQLETKQAMDNMLLAQARLDMAKAAGEMADAGYDRARTLTEMGKIDVDSRLGIIDRYLKWLELNQQTELARLQAGQRAGSK